MSEQFAFDEFAGNGGAVHLHERHRAAGTELVEVTRHEFLAGTVGADDQHAGVGGRHLRDHLANVLHRGGIADHVGAVHLLLERLVLGGQHHPVSGVLDRDQDAVQVQRLLDEVEGAQLDAVHGGLDVGVAGNHHHGGVQAHFHEFREHLGAVHPGHLDVAEDDVVFLLFNLLERHEPVFGGIDFVAFVAEDLPQRIADRPLVVYDQNFHLCVFL